MDQTHENLIHRDLNTIAGVFSGGGNSASKCKRYAQEVMTLDTRMFDCPTKPSLCFTTSDLEDVFPHEDDSVVIFVVTVGTFTNLQISPDQFRPYDGYLVDFTSD